MMHMKDQPEDPFFHPSFRTKVAIFTVMIAVLLVANWYGASKVHAVEPDCHTVIHKHTAVATATWDGSKAALRTTGGTNVQGAGAQNANLRCGGTTKLPRQMTFDILRLQTTAQSGHANVTANFIARGPNGEVLFVQRQLSSTRTGGPNWRYRERDKGYLVTFVDHHVAGETAEVPIRRALRKSIRKLYPETRLFQWEVKSFYIGTESADRGTARITLDDLTIES